MPEQRKPGFYWLRLNVDGSIWEVAEYLGKSNWTFCGRGNEDECDERSIIEIFEARLLSPVEQSGAGTQPNQWGPLT